MTVLAAPRPADPRAAIEVAGLRLVTADGTVLVDDVSLSLPAGETLGIVGESGSGKSLTCKTILGVLPPGVSVAAGSVHVDGVEVTGLSHEQWMPLRGTTIAAVFQDPVSYLNPSVTIGRQLSEVLRVRAGLSRGAAGRRAAELLASVGLRDVERVRHSYPFEVSGGMAQRAVLALALAADPAILVADEATTALDVTVQAEVLRLLRRLREERRLSLLFVSHDLAVVSEMCDRVLVMREGRVVEQGRTRDVLDDPQHEYTRLLVRDHREYGLERFLAGSGRALSPSGRTT